MATGDRLTEDPLAANARGIRAKVSSGGQRYYTTHEAALLAGVEPSTAYRRYAAETLVGPDGRTRKYVPAEPVDRHRTEALVRLGVADQRVIPLGAPSQRGPSASAERPQARPRADVPPNAPTPPTIPSLPPPDAVNMDRLLRDLLVAEDLAEEMIALEQRRTAIYRAALRQLLPLEIRHD